MWALAVDSTLLSSKNLVAGKPITQCFFNLSSDVGFPRLIDSSSYKHGQRYAGFDSSPCQSNLFQSFNQLDSRKGYKVPNNQIPGREAKFE